MGKYKSVNDDIYSIFASPAWNAVSIKALPDNFSNTKNFVEFIRISVLTHGSSLVNPPRSVSGQLMIDIFVPAGQGMGRLLEVADVLDTFLAGRSIATSSGGTTQLGVSSLAPNGLDSANASLFRGTYSISFNYFGF